MRLSECPTLSEPSLNKHVIYIFLFRAAAQMSIKLLQTLTCILFFKIGFVVYIVEVVYSLVDLPRKKKGLNFLQTTPVPQPANRQTES